VGEQHPLCGLDEGVGRILWIHTHSQPFFQVVLVQLEDRILAGPSVSRRPPVRRKAERAL